MAAKIWPRNCLPNRSAIAIFDGHARVTNRAWRSRPGVLHPMGISTFMASYLRALCSSLLSCLLYSYRHILRQQQHDVTNCHTRHTHACTSPDAMQSSKRHMSARCKQGSLLQPAAILTDLDFSAGASASCSGCIDAYLRRTAAFMAILRLRPGLWPWPY